MDQPPPKRYPPCEPRRRAVARVVDLAFAAGIWWAISGDVAGPLASAAYFLLADGAGGQSPGKRLAGIRAIDPRTGVPCGFARSTLRNAAFAAASLAGTWSGFGAGLVGWGVVCAVECVAVWRDEDGRRFGDHAAGTQVVDASIPLSQTDLAELRAPAAAAPIPPVRAALRRRRRSLPRPPPPAPSPT